ncbi:MAG: AsmA-like C-terminal region-containing protein, partial [Xanthobacteraceae bacterium]|nr:AsmA-like C-terminal region-containing protein [Xanthobacteraceae bacterium]
RDLRADLGVREGALALERLEARLPGRGSIKATGTGSGSETFSGDVSLEAEDSAAFARWLTGAASASIEENGPLRVGGRVEFKPPRFAIDKLDFALSEAKLSGRLVLTAAEGKRMRIETDLVADGIDLDLLAPLAGAARAGSDTLDLQLGFKGRGLRLLDHPLRQIDAALSRSAEGVAVERLSIDDFDGVSLKARGRIAAPWERANGRIEFEIEAARAEGLAALAQALAGDDAAALTRRIASLGPVKLSGAASGDGSAAGVAIEAQGRLSEIQASLRARFDPRTGSLEETRIRLEAQEAGRLVTLLGLTPGPPAPGDGRLEVAVLRGRAGALPFTARLRVPGANLTADGEIRSGGGRIEPRLSLRLEAVDLRPLLAAAARASGDQELPASGTARLERTGDALAFENIAVNIGNVRARGRIEVAGIERPARAGKLGLERAELAGLLGLVLGRAGEGSSFWPEVPLGIPPLAGATGTVEFDVGALEFAGRLSATGAKFKLRLGADDAAIEDFTAELAGGKLAGNARIVRGDPLALDGRLALGQFEIARLLVPGTWRAAARGRGNLLLAFAGNGRTPAELAAKLAGQGMLALEAFEIDQLDPEALAAVLAATESSQPSDATGTLALLAPALAKGSLRLSKLEAPVILAAGVARTGKARASAGPVQVTAEGNLDLARLSVDAAIELEGAAPEGLTAKSAATVRWRGPLAAPEREIDAAALATAIALSAVERETGRLEGRPRPRKPSSTALLPAGVPLPLPRPRDLGSPLTAAPPLPPAAEIPPAPRAVPLPPQR